MSAPLRLVIFDVDGTLVDSQADILAAMAHAFAAVDAAMPPRAAVLGIVGLSLPQAMARLAPHLPEADHAGMIARYKAAYMGLRAANGVAASSPLYPHVADMLAEIHKWDAVLMGVATGKSARGLAKLIDGHGLAHHFVTRQVADHHPSKPHPSMLRAALAETGVAPRDAVMVGDTTYDMEMARAAGIAAVGVSWGYHDVAALTPLADAMIDDMRDLPAVLNGFAGRAR